MSSEKIDQNRARCSSTENSNHLSNWFPILRGYRHNWQTTFYMPSLSPNLSTISSGIPEHQWSENNHPRCSSAIPLPMPTTNDASLVR